MWAPEPGTILVTLGDLEKKVEEAKHQINPAGGLYQWMPEFVEHMRVCQQCRQHYLGCVAYHNTEPPPICKIGLAEYGKYIERFVKRSEPVVKRSEPGGKTQ